MLAVAHSERGALSAGARQAVAAAALLAQADTAVHLLVFGDCRDDPAALGADMLIQAQAPAAHAPDLALAALLAEIAGDPPLHIFMSDEDPDDADLGRRLGAHTGYTAATGVVSLNASEAFRMAGPAQLARCPCPASCCWPPTPSTRPCPAPAVACAASSLAAGARALSRTGALQAGRRRAGIGRSRSDRLGRQRRARPGEFPCAGDRAGRGRRRQPRAGGRWPLSRSQQIGATGKTVSASLYLAFGISGAVQHLQGIKDCRHVIAVNLDASAPLIKRADLSIIDDAHSVTRALLDEVARARQAARTPLETPHG